MAILNNITQDNSQYGIAFNGAYYRIATANICRLMEAEPIKFRVSIDLVAFATSKPTDSTKDVDFRRYTVSLEEIEIQTGNTFLEKCYKWVMVQSDMVGCEEI